MSTSAPEVVAHAPATLPVLRVSSLSAWYGELRAIHDVSLELQAGEVLAVIGANGAGKSTLLRSLVGLMSHGVGTRIRGTIEFEGRRLDRMRPDQVVDAGVALVPEGRRLFARMSVEDNLLAGAFLPRCRATLAARLEDVYALFPRLRERRGQLVSQMSGGEQQMVAIGRALMSSPRLIAFDELSLGLSPAMVDEIYRKVAHIIQLGATCIVVEQDLRRALSACTRFVVMLEGSIVLEGRPGEVDEDAITAAYFGDSAAAHG
ncbi:MAG: ABC transporter ATP-binding protein [Burkholderiaceae bacterium]|nr:ABC transporter ATP-binding protein [Burkholderiaceae bacterium]MEB2351549.1 ABC transporter ATP-binding protein [Burkholderiaceae bacterium]